MSRRVGRQNRRLSAGTFVGQPSVPSVYGVPMSSIAQWHKGDAGVTSSGGFISAVADQTTNARDWTQSTPGLQPTIGTLNGLATISWPSPSYHLIGPSLSALTGGGEWFFVTSTSSAASIFAVQWGSSGVDGLCPYSDGNYYSDFASASRIGTNASTTVGAHVVEIISIANEMTLTIDGVQKYTTPVNTVGWYASTFIGKGAAGNHAVNVQLAESIVYIGKASSADRLVLRAALKAKWGTP